MRGARIRANEVQKTIEPVRQPGRELIRQQEQGPAQAVAPQVAYRRAQLNHNGPRPADILALQRAVGNCGVQRMVASHVDRANDEQQSKNTEVDAKSTAQTKLSVSAPSDLYEQRTDRVAGQVMTMPEAATQRTNRTGLPDVLKSGIESRSGMSLDNVNVHYNSARPVHLNALAYTQGSDIHVAPGQERHLPHEAWHVVQQARGRVRPTMQMKDGVPVNDDQGLEHEADVVGAKAVATPAQGSRSYGGLVTSDMTHVASQVQRCMCTEQRTGAEERSSVPAGVGEPYKPVIPVRLRPHSANAIQRAKCTFWKNDDCTGSKFEAQSFHNVNNQDSPAKSWNCSRANGDNTCHTPLPKKGDCVCASGHNTGKAPNPPKETKKEKKEKKRGASNKK